MSVYATQCPMAKQNNQLVPKFKLGIDDPLGRELRHSYGSLIWVLSPNDAPWTPGVFDKMGAAMRGYTENDHLLCLGNPVLMSMMAVFAAEHSNTIRFLQFSNGEYMPLVVQL